MKILNDELFLKRYQQLNEQQKEAVNTIYGPVMVIAGPGTGKTEVLAMRIANLLRSEAQVKPQEILCLTFTDEGTVSMRKRLLQIIGEAAHRVHIFTFHAFCNSIIQSNMEYFGVRDLMPISDLERMDLIYEIIEKLEPGHLLRRLKGDIFFDAQNLLSLFDLMKSEDWNSEQVGNAIDFYIESLPEREKYIYKRANAKTGIKVGDLKEADIKKETEKMERTRAAAMLYPLYQQRMEEMGRYDFSDMILWVLKAFKERPDFLQSQQERFQFLLVDEFQDTSGAQSELLNMLADYWEDPNLFIVGDDDQSIFEFQGARLKNIKEVYERYRNTIKVIVLKENYRSSQLILDKSMASIRQNRQRLINQLQELELDKNIIAANQRFKAEISPAPSVSIYYNQLHEDAEIVNAIERLHADGVALNNVAVLYAQHKQAASIIDSLERRKLPYWVKRPVNILDLPLVQQLLNVFRYLQAEQTKPMSGEEWIFLLLHSPFFNLTAIDVATLSLYIQTKTAKHKRWRYLLQDDLLLETLDLQNAGSLRKLGHNLERWITELQTLTLPMVLQKILYDGGVVAHVMKQEGQIWDMQVLHTFFEFIKDECDKKPRMSVRELLTIIGRMDDEGISLPIQKTVQQENGVRFYTAFSAKGHEFEHVFIVGVTKNFWEGKRGGNGGFSLPETLTTLAKQEEDINNTEEVARRLFYVGMTRAKKHLHISYAQKDNKEKALEPSMFIDEISEAEDRTDKGASNEEVMTHMATLLMPEPPVQITLVKKELLERRLENFVLSVSAMNKYLNCPLAFYYEYILRVPEAKSDALSFGIAIHFALEQLFKKMNIEENKNFHSKEDLIKDFRYAMKREEGSFTLLQFERRLEMGSELLSDYYEKYIATFNKIVLTEYNVNQVTINGVPAKGKLDKIEFTGKECVVIDYKTGSPDRASRKELLGPSEDHPMGGDYWRQMVFYRLLLNNFPPAFDWKMTAGIFDFIEKNKAGEYVRFTIPIQEHDLTIVKQQVKDVYGKIMNHEFNTGCNNENCRWCNFAKTYQLNAPGIEDEE
ncbi:MAG TPA: ATP-dependent DNA helicase [Flavipsychrobacter sp.]|nr:ATP-dependent DNA helicase [Flavipsychrobacter sp.]